MELTYGELSNRAVQDDLGAKGSLEWLTQTGDAMAVFPLGRLYDVPSPGASAADRTAPATGTNGLRAGHAGAQVALGNMFDTGEGVPEDAVEARRWNELAASQGNSGAQMHLGKMFQIGRGGPQSAIEEGSFVRVIRPCVTSSTRSTANR
ncbi:MAG: tetratricopeptide repeat protein [Alphaproteobacteria bacterium]